MLIKCSSIFNWVLITTLNCLFTIIQESNTQVNIFKFILKKLWNESSVDRHPNSSKKLLSFSLNYSKISSKLEDHWNQSNCSIFIRVWIIYRGREYVLLIPYRLSNLSAKLTLRIFLNCFLKSFDTGLWDDGNTRITIFLWIKYSNSIHCKNKL